MSLASTIKKFAAPKVRVRGHAERELQEIHTMAHAMRTRISGTGAMLIDFEGRRIHPRFGVATVLANHRIAGDPMLSEYEVPNGGTYMAK